MNTYRTLLLLAVAWLMTALAPAIPPLERVITIDLRNERLGVVLDRISQAGQFSFSYNPDILNENSVVNLRVANTTVRSALQQLFTGSLTFKSRGNHIILLKADEPEEPKSFILDGYIIDGRTGTRISQASIYERNTLASTVSNPYGYYRLKLPTSLPAARLEVRKQAYEGETVRLATRRNQTLDIQLRPAALETPTVRPISIRTTVDTTRPVAIVTPPVLSPRTADTTLPAAPASKLKSEWQRTQEQFTNWLLSQRQKIHEANLTGDTLYRDMQFSLLPFVGTNHTLSGQVINNLSFNLIAGYSMGVTALEVGGFLNIVRGNVSGLQAAGFANAVGENVTGIQLAGFLNANRKNFDGIQAAGFGNTVGGDFRGVQAAGYFNLLAGSLRQGIQIAPFLNVVGQDLNGVQVAAVLNVTGRYRKGWQISGYGNVTLGNGDGGQVAGLFNLTKEQQTGPQIGAINIAGSIRRGRQIGLVNVAKTAEKPPIGLFTFVRENGYRRLELTTDELHTGNLTFKTGKRSFYNLFTFGSNPGVSQPTFLSLGYGFGSALDFGRGWMINADLSGRALLYTGEQRQTAGTLLRLNTALEKKLTSRLALVAGPTLNVSLGRSAPPLWVEANRTSGFNWVGFQAGLRFCNI